MWVIWVSLCHEFVKSDDLEHYGLNKKLPTQSRMLPPLNELSYFSFVCRLHELLLSLLLIYVLVDVYYVQYIQYIAMCFVQLEISSLKFIIFIDGG